MSATFAGALGGIANVSSSASAAEFRVDHASHQVLFVAASQSDACPAQKGDKA